MSGFTATVNPGGFAGSDLFPAAACYAAGVATGWVAADGVGTWETVDVNTVSDPCIIQVWGYSADGAALPCLADYSCTAPVILYSGTIAPAAPYPAASAASGTVTLAPVQYDAISGIMIALAVVCAFALGFGNGSATP